MEQKLHGSFRAEYFRAARRWMGRDTMTLWPAALRLDQAAEYSGLSVDTFKAVCPVKPIAFTQSTRGNRYLRANLDAWLSSLDPNAQPSPIRRFGEKLGGKGAAVRA
jgi:hypothetical protein